MWSAGGAPFGAGNLQPGQLALLVFVIGAGSQFFSHVNDGGFCMVGDDGR
ncbi:hypothetical protein [Paenarthrobacter sp. PH39-S1]|nr:hypothetical protein [Paenarthrobacter sp. PH39-S1]MDJ0354531.1 hypothetical protein [Paenarthrobacter sp. PH39-S1]